MRRRRTAAAVAVSAAALVLLPLPATAADVPPGPVGALTARPGSGRVDLRWTLPADNDLAGVTILRRPGATPAATPTDASATVIARSLGRTWSDRSGLVNGSTYTYTLWVRDVGGSYSAARSVSARPVPAPATTMSVSTSARVVGYGGALRVSGSLHRATSGSGVAGEPVRLQLRVFGSTVWRPGGTATTSSGGAVSFLVHPVAGAAWRLVHPASPWASASSSRPVGVGVRPTLRAHLSATTAGVQQAVVLRGTTWPVPSGRLLLQTVRSGAWTTLTSAPVASTGAFAVTIRAGAGRHLYRVLRRGTTVYTTTASSAETLTVYGGLGPLARTLRTGTSGADVALLQRRLAVHHYDLGAADGHFGYQTLKAVEAFQKVQALPRTGVVDQRTWSRLGAPVAPQLRSPQSGLQVEVNLSKQVLYLARGGVITKIVTISSGSNAYYYSGGTRYRAATPTGRFHVTRKIDGVRVSRLGELYRPAYFYQGWAVHGSPSVPVYPASHGCIRVPNPSMDRLFPALPVGTSVYLYF